MTKTYKSASIINFPLTIGGSYRRIKFQALTSGGSIYSTSDEAEIKALEAHHYMDKLYKLEQVQEDMPKQEVEKVITSTVAVTDITEARDYLISHYGFMASNLRSKKAIYDAAEAQGITFTGI